MMAILIGLTVVIAGPALACSQAEAIPLAELATGRIGDRAVAGVYEQRHIAAAPSLLVRDERTVSVVTRYWGDPPPDVGPVVHGRQTILYQDSCGNEAGQKGMVGYGWTWVGETTRERGLPWVTLGDAGTWETVGTIDAGQEALLEAAFGDPQILEVSLFDRVLSHGLLWWPPAALTALVASIGYGVMRLRRRVS